MLTAVEVTPVQFSHIPMAAGPELQMSESTNNMVGRIQLPVWSWQRFQGGETGSSIRRDKKLRGLTLISMFG